MLCLVHLVTYQLSVAKWRAHFLREFSALWNEGEFCCKHLQMSSECHKVGLKLCTLLLKALSGVLVPSGSHDFLGETWNECQYFPFQAFCIIIVVIIMWTTKKFWLKNEPDITDFKTAHWSKWVNFMQNLEHVSELATWCRI